MKIFNYSEAFIEAYKLYGILGNVAYDEFLNIFHSVNDPAVRGIEVNPSDVGVVVDEDTVKQLTKLFNRISYGRDRSASAVLIQWAADILHKPEVSDLRVKLLFDELLDAQQ